VYTIWEWDGINYLQNSGIRSSWVRISLLNSAFNLGPFAWGQFSQSNHIDIFFPDEDDSLVRSLVSSDMSGGFSVSSPSINPGSPKAAKGIQFNADGKLDIVFGHSNGRITIYTNNYPDSGFTWTSPDFNIDDGGNLGNVYDVQVADLNGDGHEDIAFVGANTGYIPCYGDGTVGTIVYFTGASQGGNKHTYMSLADIDGDGDIDITVTAADYTTPLQVWWNYGNGVFSEGETSFGDLFDAAAGSSVTLGRSFGGIAWGDLDDDGTVDAIITQYDQTVSKSTIIAYSPFGADYTYPRQDCSLGSYGASCECTYVTDGVTTEDPVVLVAADTKIVNGNLEVVFNEPVKYKHRSPNRPHIRFTDADGNEGTGADTCYNLFSWTRTEADPLECDSVRTWKGVAALSSVLDGSNSCAHVTALVGNNDEVTMRLVVVDAEWVDAVEGDSDDPDGTTTGIYVKRYVEHLNTFTLNFPRSIDVSVSNVEVFSEVVAARALILSTVGTSSSSDTQITVDMFLSVQHPFKVEFDTTGYTPVQPASYTVTDPVLTTEYGYTCLDVDNSNCDQVFRWVITDPGSACNFDGEYKMRFDVVCNSDACPLDGTETVEVTYVLDTDDHCPVAVVDTVELQSALTSYSDSGHSAAADEFLDGDQMYFEAEVWSEDTSLKGAQLFSVAISGTTLGSDIMLFDNGDFVADSNLVANWAFANIDVSNQATDPTAPTTSRLNPSFEFKARDTILNVATRSTSDFTITAVFDVQYTVQVASVSSEKPEHVVRTQRVRREFRPSEITGERASASTPFRVASSESTASSSSEGPSIGSTSNLVLVGVCAVSFFALVAALVAVRRSRNSKHSALKEDDIVSV